MIKQNFWLKFTQSLGIRLFFITFLSIVLLVSVLGIGSYTLSKQLIMDKVADAQQQTIEQAGDKMDAMLENYAGLTRQLLVDTKLQAKFLKLSDPNLGTFERSSLETEVRNQMDSLRSANPGMISIRLVPKSLEQKRIISTTGASSPQINDQIKTDLAQLLDANGEVAYLPTMSKGLFGFSAEPSFMLGRLLKNMKQSDTEYIVLFEFPAQLLSDTFANLTFGDDGRLVVVTDQNKIVYSADQEEIGTDSVESSAEHLKVQHLSETTGWALIGTVPIAALVSETRTILTLTLWMSILAIVVALLIGFLLIKMVARPLERLCALMEQAEGGDLTVRIHGKRKDEIGRLGSSFNRMIGQISALVERTNESAQEVRTRAAELNEVSQEMRLSSENIASSSGQIADGAASLAGEAENGLGTVDNIMRKMETVAQTNQRLNSSADRVQQTSSEAADQMLGLVQLTNDTEQKSQALLYRIDKLKESSSSIRKILDVMNNIARQTNILSLNATIEAARSGAAGKSFMVVAEEIRKLAEQSKQSISDVDTMTEAIQFEVEATISELHAVMPMLQEQSTAVKSAADTFGGMEREMKEVLREIASSSSSILELDGSQQLLVMTIGNVSAVSEEAAASSSEVASLTSDQLFISGKLVSLSNKLESVSNELNQQLMKFRTE